MGIYGRDSCNGITVVLPSLFAMSYEILEVLYRRHVGLDVEIWLIDDEGATIDCMIWAKGVTKRASRR